MREEACSGIDAVDGVTALLQRMRNLHPTAGVYQAAEPQFWWARPRRTDDLDQLFWYDDDGLPEAAAVFFDFGDNRSILYTEVTFCPLTLPGVSAERIAQVIDRGLEHAANNGFEVVELEVGTDDEVTQGLLVDRGFVAKDPEFLIECLMPVETSPEVSPLADGYRLVARSDVPNLPHHMAGPTGDAYEPRLHQLSLYRPDLDLVVLTGDDEPAGWGMFWHDPTTGMGVVEPMRTDDEHQQRGLARHILTSGVARLREAGAGPISIGYEPDNPSSGHLYRSVGFEPHASTALYSGPTS
jgi:ribosomal protein S18 acetylase RimI-like enzyme